MGRTKSEKRLRYEKFIILSTNSDGESSYTCTKCNSSLPGIKAANFISHSEDHFLRCHPEINKEINESTSQRQLQISDSFNVVSQEARLLEEIALSFAHTILPMNFFRCSRIEKFIENVIKRRKLPAYKTIEKYIDKLSNSKIKEVQQAEYYGIQLDHWTNQVRQNILIVSASWISKRWEPKSQVLDFQIVPNTKSAITAQQVKSILENCNLDAKKCLAFQSDNCNAMIASCQKFKILLSEVDEEQDLEIVQDTFEVEGTSQDIIDVNAFEYAQFVGCGAHKLNNAILDAVNEMVFFVQLNNFCCSRNVNGPRLCTTRWHGIYKQLKFVQNNSMLLNSERQANPRLYRLLDVIPVSEMFAAHEKLLKLGKFLETQNLVADNIVYAVKELEKACVKACQSDRLCDIVKQFFSRFHTVFSLDHRFGVFPSVLLCCSLLNPNKRARRILTDHEKNLGTTYLKSFERHILQEVGEVIEVPQPVQQSKTSMSAVDELFEEFDEVIKKKPRMDKAESFTLIQEFEKFDSEINIPDKTAFEFFSQNTSFTKLRDAAHALLGILPSPANCERSFSRAAILTDGRQNRIKMKSVKDRLILL